MFLWDRESGRIIRTFPGQSGTVWPSPSPPTAAAPSPAAEDKIIRLWDLESGAVLREFRGHTDWVIRVAFSPDGHRIYSTSGGNIDNGVHDGTDSAVRIWDSRTRKQIGQMSGHKGIVWGLAVSRDGKRVLTGGDTVILWDVETRRRSIALMVTRPQFTPWPSYPMAGAPSRLPGTVRSGSGTSKAAWSSIASGATDWGHLCHGIPRWPPAALVELGWTGLAPLGRRGPHSSDQVDWLTGNPTCRPFTPDGRHALWTGHDGVVRSYRLAAPEQGRLRAF